MDWHRQTDERQRDLLGLVSRRSALPALSVEKDWWVTQALTAVFKTEWTDKLVFKGGTSLSKAWGLIERFSEDIDLALDRSALGYSGTLAKSQIRKLRKDSCSFISGPFRDSVEMQLLGMGISPELFILKAREVVASDTDPQILELHYRSVLEKGNYLRDAVLIEVGSRSMMEPAEQRKVSSLLTETLGEPALSGHSVSVPAVTPGRTFLEKVFLLHEELNKPGESRVRDRMSRHLYDLERLMDTQYALDALNDRELYTAIVEHRSRYSPVSGIDYQSHLPNRIEFVPSEPAIQQWANDYRAMQENMIYGRSITFSQLIGRMLELKERFRSL